MNEEFQPTNENMEEMEFVVSTKAWEDFITPFLRQLRESAIHMLLNPDQERKDKVSDDTIRGRVQILDTILGFPIFVARWRENKAREDALRSDPDRIEERAALGHPGPLG